MGIAERIAIERKRLGLSQAEFASKAGISLSSQKRYEKGERNPDSAYLEALESIGADLFFINFGSREEDYQSDRYAAAECFLMALSEALHIGRDGFRDQIDKIQAAYPASIESDDTTEINALTQAAIASVFNNSPLLDPHWRDTFDELAIMDYAKIVEKFDTVQLSLGLQKSIRPAKKAQSIAMLWRTLRSGGKVDAIMIEEAVKLAAD